MMSGMPASSISVCSAPATRASRSFSSSGATATRFRGEQINDRIDQRARVEDARIDDVLQCRLRTSMSRTTCWRATPARASGADRWTTARPSRRRRPNRSSSTCAPPTQAMASRAQRRACGSLPSFGETRRGIRRHGDARLGAAKRVERDAKLRQQHRRLRHAHRIVWRASCRRAAQHDVMHSLRRCRHAHRQRRPHAPHCRVNGIAL
jgi:hypothetical protein